MKKTREQKLTLDFTFYSLFHRYFLDRAREREINNKKQKCYFIHLYLQN